MKLGLIVLGTLAGLAGLSIFIAIVVAIAGGKEEETDATTTKPWKPSSSITYPPVVERIVRVKRYAEEKTSSLFFGPGGEVRGSQRLEETLAKRTVEEVSTTPARAVSTTRQVVSSTEGVQTEQLTKVTPAYEWNLEDVGLGDLLLSAHVGNLSVKTGRREPVNHYPRCDNGRFDWNSPVSWFGGLYCYAFSSDVREVVIVTILGGLVLFLAIWSVVRFVYGTCRKMCRSEGKEGGKREKKQEISRARPQFPLPRSCRDILPEAELGLGERNTPKLTSFKNGLYGSVRTIGGGWMHARPGLTSLFREEPVLDSVGYLTPVDVRRPLMEADSRMRGGNGFEGRRDAGLWSHYATMSRAEIKRYPGRRGQWQNGWGGVRSETPESGVFCSDRIQEESEAEMGMMDEGSSSVPSLPPPSPPERTTSLPEASRPMPPLPSPRTLVRGMAGGCYTP